MILPKRWVATGTLTAICAAAVFILGVVNAFTEKRIVVRREAEFLSALNSLAPGGATVGERVPLPQEEPYIQNRYPLLDAKGEVIGQILELTGEGYGGPMKLLASFKADGTILQARLLDNEETPGLGKKAEDSSYMKKFLGTGSSTNPVPTTKAEVEESPDSIAGATITFKGVAYALEAGSKFVAALPSENR